MNILRQTSWTREKIVSNVWNTYFYLDSLYMSWFVQFFHNGTTCFSCPLSRSQGLFHIFFQYKFSDGRFLRFHGLHIQIFNTDITSVCLSKAPNLYHFKTNIIDYTFPPELQVKAMLWELAPSRLHGSTGRCHWENSLHRQQRQAQHMSDLMRGYTAQRLSKSSNRFSQG